MTTFIEPGARGYIYLLTFGNGKKYVGQSVNFENRFSEHKRCHKHGTTKLYKGWRKHGLVSSEIVFVCRIRYLDEFEIRFIAEYDSQKSGYNTTAGGDENLQNSPEGRASYKAAVEKYWADPNNRAAHMERLKAQWADPERRAARSKSSKAKWADPEYRAAQSEKAKAQWAYPEFRTAVSEAAKAELKKRWEDPEYRAAQTERTKLQSMARWADAEYKAAQIDGMLVTWTDPEVRRQRLTRVSVSVEVYGTFIGVFSSISRAFIVFDLPYIKHKRFRLKVKAEGTAVFEHEGTEYTFRIADPGATA